MEKKNTRQQFTRQHSMNLRKEISALLARSNVYIQPARRVALATAIEVANRDLRKTRNNEPDARMFSAIKAVSSFVSLAAKNKVDVASLANTDLLSVGHPLSEKRHAMTASGILRAKAQWIAADEAIDDSARPLVLLAHALPPKSVERQHAFARIAALGPSVVPITAAVDPFAS